MISGAAVEQALSGWVRTSTLILGVGNPLRGDDAAGPMVCAQLGSPGAVDCGDAPERHLGLADDPNVGQVLIVDAMDFGGEPGEMAFCTAEDLVERFGTTHDSGLALLARFVEQQYGKPVAVLGIQPADTGFGAEVNAAVRAAVDRVSASLKPVVTPRETGEMEAAWTRL
jgi:hydrogenase 3 maturation protease